MKKRIDAVSLAQHDIGFMSLFIHRGDDCKSYISNQSKRTYRLRSARILQFALAYAARLPGAVEKKERKPKAVES